MDSATRNTDTMKTAHYDRHSFDGRRSRPVKRYTSKDENVLGISFEDYGKMGSQQHKQSGERRLETPKWALNNKLLQELLVTFMEERTGIRGATGALFARLEIARHAVVAQHPRLLETAKRLCAEYVQVKNVGVHPELTDEDVNALLPQPELYAPYARKRLTGQRKRELEIEIEGIDTYLRYTQGGGADVLAAIVYLYYRAGLDSVGVGEELDLKPPHVRQLLWRLNQTWKEKFKRHHDRPETQAAKAVEPLWEFLKAELGGIANDAA